MASDSRKQTWAIWYIIAAVFGVLLLQQVWSAYQQTETIPYSEFEKRVADKQVSEVVIGSDTIEGTLKSPEPNGVSKFITVRVDPALADKLAADGIKVTGAPPSGLVGVILAWVIPALLFYALWVFLFRGFAEKQGFGGLMTIGKSHAKVYVETDTKVTFKDVAGVEEAKFELQEVVSFLKDPKSFGRLGARAPKGILLVGPPGTGKTLLARAVAGEAGVAFFSISGSEFVEMFVGVGAARVRDLFEQARKAAPCIIFIDELDALGRSRTVGGIGGVDEKEQTLNQLLAELDGFDPSIGVILLAATNRPEILDPALLRAGRFDRQVLVDRPDRKGRLEILKVHAKKIVLDPAADLDQVASITTGFTGADLANLVNEAAVIATRRKSAAATIEDFTAAIERIVAGIEKKSRILTPPERRRVAYHEMGHALVAASLPDVDPVLKVSIIPRGVGALGYTIQRPTEDRFVLAASELRHRITVLMGGRAAETLLFEGDISTGAADDLQRATDIAVEMVTLYGMAQSVGQRTYKAPPQFLLGSQSLDKPAASEATLREIDLSVRDIVGEAFVEARDILARRRGDLDKGAELLLAKESITAEDFPPIQRPQKLGVVPALSA
ncbi:ATP-dependent zinc metalloprotease FtsH [Methylocapsa polymorpha]|uniref:ATP-dependent zinc metalloprotease FtsH n=1 Tax=Methylocapsa polymorpha TaxID=3080828 RepID=A0ABZ0HLY1_9HYPH|nr:ATP-dependent zinc metalloprotease FtsH [Methylocapsa sp. RX1]